MKNLLLRVLSVIIIAVSAPMSANASSAAITKYSAFAKQHDKMPSEKIMAAAAKLENAAARMRASPVRARITPPRLRIRTSVLAFAFSPQQRNTPLVHRLTL